MRYYAKQKIISSGGVFAAGEIVIGLKKSEITCLLEAGALIVEEPQQIPDKKEQATDKKAPIKSEAVETDISSDTETSEDANQLELEPEENGAVDGKLEDNQKNDDINQ